jgi:hypothetical protein
VCIPASQGGGRGGGLERVPAASRKKFQVIMEVVITFLLLIRLSSLDDFCKSNNKKICALKAYRSSEKC